ncbi:hypothetical protein C8R45DRAFT_969849 [Mycena sanguinolenta]|nr:hypothetical protein C8R45DRAFT_969849 [Mycena sanguinolenta]
MSFLSGANSATGRDEFVRALEGAAPGFPESPLSHKNTRPVLVEPPEDKEEPVVHVPKPPDSEPRVSYATAINGLGPRQVLLENTYKCHKRTGTHYKYTRFFLRPRPGLPDDLLISPRFVRHIWTVNSGKPCPVWIAHERHQPFSVSTFSVHALDLEVRFCTKFYSRYPENRAVVSCPMKLA